LFPFGLEQNIKDLARGIHGTPEIEHTAADPIGRFFNGIQDI